VDDVRVGNIERSNPNWRAVLSETYTRGIFDATARLNYFGEYTSFFDPVTSGVAAGFESLYPNPWPKTFGAQVSLDLEVGATIKENYRIAVGAQNLLNTFPERETRNIFPQTGGAANGSVYPDTAPIGQMGGFWYVRASARF
jgi:iron complex outermembrane receptor protein